MYDEADLNDIFAEMFGGGAGMGGMGGMGGGSERRKPTKVADTVVDYDVTLEDMYMCVWQSHMRCSPVN
jgi:DnaJ family protein A protein 2